DTRAGAAFDPSKGVVINRWSGAMLDADGDGVTGGAGDYQRISALRIAVVARAKAPERQAAGAAACSTTTALPVVFAGVEPTGVTTAATTVKVAVANDPVDWKCYRYRVFETIVPIRNAAWRPL
ncbi:MAG: pilus assembly protein PilW, partial [Massilia sp.]